MVDYVKKRNKEYLILISDTNDSVLSRCPTSHSTEVINTDDELQLGLEDLVSWCFQVAKAMEYLEKRKVVHGDLASRNVLLHHDNIVKICDFGLSKNLYDKNYIKKPGGALPVKWMALESLHTGKFSTKSDIWSFGITMWEIFTLAMTPYPGIESVENLIMKLNDGYRLDQPPYAPKEVYTIMKECWKIEPFERPSFTLLAERIGELIGEETRSRFMTLYADCQGTTKQGDNQLPTTNVVANSNRNQLTYANVHMNGDIGHINQLPTANDVANSNRNHLTYAFIHKNEDDESCNGYDCGSYKLGINQLPTADDVAKSDRNHITYAFIHKNEDDESLDGNGCVSYELGLNQLHSASDVANSDRNHLTYAFIRTNEDDESLDSNGCESYELCELQEKTN